jgi:hypothetical protein
MKNSKVIAYFLMSFEKDRRCDGTNLYVRGNSLLSYNGSYVLAKLYRQGMNTIVLVNTNTQEQGKATRQHRNFLLASVPSWMTVIYISDLTNFSVQTLSAQKIREELLCMLNYIENPPKPITTRKTPDIVNTMPKSDWFEKMTNLFLLGITELRDDKAFGEMIPIIRQAFIYTNIAKARMK